MKDEGKKKEAKSLVVSANRVAGTGGYVYALLCRVAAKQ
jgi:hypothetical protein